MRTFNVRLAAILGVSFLVFGVGVYFLHGYQLQRNAGFFLVKAKEAEEEAKNARKQSEKLAEQKAAIDKIKEVKQAERKAIEEQLTNLFWFIILAPKDDLALDTKENYSLLRAENIRGSSDFGQCLFFLQQVVSTDPERSKSRKKLIELWMTMPRYKDALSYIDYFLKKTPDDAEMLTLKGQCQAGINENKKAKASFLDAIKYSPAQCEAYFRLSLLLQEHPELCDRPDAEDPTATGSGGDSTKPKTVEHTPESLMAEMLEKNPDSAKAHLYMCQYLLSQKGTLETRKAALEQAEKSLELDPKDREALFLAMRCSLATGDLEKARKYALQGLALEKDLERFRREMYLTLADAEYRLKNRDKALEILQKGFKESRDPIFVWVQADWQIDANEIELAQKSIQQLTEKNYDSRGMDYLRGKISFLRKEWGDALRSFKLCRPYFSNRPDKTIQILYWSSICYGYLGNTDQQMLLLKEVLSNDPTFELARVDMARINAQVNQIVDLPLPEILSMIKNSKDTRSMLTLIPLAIATKRKFPKDDQNWKELEDILDEVGKNFPDFAELPLFRCNILIAQDRGEEAEKTLLQLAEKNPKNAQYWHALTGLYVQKKKFDEAEKSLAEFEKTAGDTLDLRLMKMSYLLQRFGKDAQPQLNALAEKMDAFDDQQKSVIWQNLLAAMREIGARDDVAKYTKLMTERDPNNINYLLLSFEQAYEAGDSKRMDKISGNIQRIEGNGPYWYTSQAIINIQKSTAGGDPALLDEALIMLEKAKEKRPNWPKIPYLTGRIYDAKGDPKNALKYYQDTIELNDYQPVAIGRIVDILCKRQSVRDANAFLQQLEREHVKLSADVLKKWVVVLMNADVRDYEAALDKAHQVAADQTDNAKDLLWYGQVLSEINRLTKAANRKKVFESTILDGEKAFRRVVELNPDASDSWMNLINFLVSVDKLSDAEKAFDEARKKFTGKEGQLSIAQCLELLKKFEQAKEQYELALSANPQDVRVTRAVAEFFIRMGGAHQAERANYVKQAETLLNRIIESKEVKANKEDVLWARNKLALIISTRPGYDNIEKARKLIEENLKIDPESAADIRVQAQINCNDPKQSNRDAAIRDLKKLLDSQKASNEDRLSLVNLYLAGGNWASASELLRDLAINANDDPKYLAFYIRELLDHNEVSDAEIYLNQLQDKWPNHVVSIMLRAELMARTNKAEEALDLMKSFVDRNEAIPNDRSQRMVLMAQTLEDFVGRVLSPEQKVAADRYILTAEKYLRQYADDHPSATMQVIEFLARQRRFDDAVNMLEQNWKAANPVALYQPCILTTEAGHGAKEITDRVIKLLTEAKTHFDDHPAILLTLGDIKMGGDQYQEAEAFYREILAKNAGHTVAMNNLAVLLTVSRKNLQEALDQINKAISITGPLASMLDTRACVYVAMGKSDKALADMKDVLVEKRSSDRLFHYAQALEAAGQNNAAAVAMQDALHLGLSEKSLLTPEIPSFQRLRDKANALAPSKKNTKPAPKK